MYKGLDSEGNVVFSDTPFENAEKITPPSISVIDTPKDKTEKEVVDEKSSTEFKYMSFDIISPTNQQTIRSKSNVTVSLQLKPGLNTEENHSIWVLLDGKPHIENSQNMTSQLSQLDRGAHKIQAQIKNEGGKVIVRTRTTVFYIH